MENASFWADVKIKWIACCGVDEPHHVDGAVTALNELQPGVRIDLQDARAVLIREIFKQADGFNELFFNATDAGREAGENSRPLFDGEKPSRRDKPTLEPPHAEP